QRAYYERLPDEFREGFLRQLPPISISTAGNQKKADQIRERVVMLDGVLAELQNHRKELVALARSLEQGNTSAASVDLRTLLKPPSISGVSMRYVRKPR